MGNLGNNSILELNFLHKAWEEIFTEISQDMVGKILNLQLSFRLLGETSTTEVEYTKLLQYFIKKILSVLESKGKQVVWSVRQRISKPSSLLFFI